MGKRGIVYGKGINDMEFGWASANDWNQRVYQVWCRMICRCYSEKIHEKYPTYIGCTVCERWLKLSNFVNDIKLIDGYELWLNHPNERVSLDKDIKSNGTNKCYCLKECMFVSASENVRQAHKTRNYDNIKGEKNPMYGKNPLAGKSDEEKVERSRKISETWKGKFTGEKHPMYGKGCLISGDKNGRARKVVLIDPLTERIVFTFKYVQQARDFYGIGRNTLNRYLKGKSSKGHLYNGFLWYYFDEYESLNE